MPGLLWPSVCPTWVIARQQSRMWASSLTDVPLRPSFESLPFWGTSQSEGAEENGEIMLLFGNAFFWGGGERRGRRFKRGLLCVSETSWIFIRNWNRPPKPFLRLPLTA